MMGSAPVDTWAALKSAFTGKNQLEKEGSEGMNVIKNVLLATLLAGTVLPAASEAQPAESIPPANPHDWTRPALAEVLEQSVARSHTLKAGMAEADKARFDRHMVYQTYLPNVRLESSFRSLDQRIRFRVDPISMPFPEPNGLQVDIPPITLQDRNTFRASVEVTQVLFTGFKVPRMGQAAHHGEQARLHMVEADKQELLLEVAEAYDNLVLVEQALRVLDRADLRLQEEQRVADRAFEEGLIPAYDLTRLRIARNDLEKERIRREGDRELAARKLEHLSGISWKRFADPAAGGGSERRQSDASADLPDARLDLIGLAPDDIPQSTRPEVQALKNAGLAADYQYRASRADYFPQAYAFLRQELYEDDLSVLEPSRVMGFGLRWDLFDGFNRSRRIQKAERDRVIARERLDEMTSLVELDRRQAEVRLSVAERQLDVAGETLVEAETSLRLSTQRYRLGLAPVSEKLDAETGYQRAELEWQQAVYEQRRAAMKLLSGDRGIWTSKTMAESVKRGVSIASSHAGG
jgi:outer membrane protein TolC